MVCIIKSLSYGRSMNYWVIASWVLVAILTGINVFVFLKLKGASEQMMKMAFPGAKDMNQAMAQMQKMMGGMSGGRGGSPFSGGGRGPSGGNQNAQLQAAMDMLKQMQKK